MTCMLSRFPNLFSLPTPHSSLNMNLKNLINFALLLAATTAAAQENGYVVTGTLDLPDGTEVSIASETDTAFAVDMGKAVIIDKRFTIRGKVEKPLKSTLMTNNLQLIEKNQWPDDSIHWTYTDFFLSNGHISVAPDLSISGTSVQQDYNDLLRMGGEQGDSLWQFIDTHPHSPVAVWVANRMLQRGYRLTADEVTHLERTVSAHDDPLRMEEFAKRIEYAKKTTKNSPLIDLDLIDINGNRCQLTDVVPRERLVLIDFWASWCGICLHSMPAIKELAEKYKETFSVVAVSIDTKEKNWRMAMQKHPEPWPQYLVTSQGYDDFFHKYQVGNGVPYYLLLSTEGKVIASPSGPEEIAEMLQELTNQ